jgi:CRP-like cAMP-binding protein
MFVVRSGTLVLKAGRRVLERVGPGGIVGEMALIDPAPRSATAIGGPDCSVSAVDQLTFDKLVRHVPGLAIEVMQVLARRLRRSTVSGNARPKPTRRKKSGSAKGKAKSKPSPSKRGKPARHRPKAQPGSRKR